MNGYQLLWMNNIMNLQNDYYKYELGYDEGLPIEINK